MGKVYLKDVLSIARSEVGYREKISNKDLDDKTANAGPGNWTKFARDLEIAGYYNGPKNGYDWCDVFVDWCFYQAAGKDRTHAEFVQCQTGDCGAGVNFSAAYYKAQGRFGTEPRAGAQIFFGTSTSWQHTGIVERVENGMVYTIEGNFQQGVGRGTYQQNYYKIKGYGYPKYDDGATIDKPDGVKMFGVDLSFWQEGISLEQLKNEGAEFVILRGGDGSYSDHCFDAFFAKALEAGLPVGAYWLSRATNVKQAVGEAQMLLSRLHGRPVSFPLYIDCEADSQTAIGKRMLTDIVLAWAREIRNAGYIPGIYTTAHWMKNYMNLDELDGVEKWIAQHSNVKPAIECGMWQFGGRTNLLRSNTLAGYVVDQNYLYKNYMEDIMKRYYTLADLKADENAKKYYLPTVEKLLEKGAGSKGGEGEDTIIDMGEDTVRMLAILDRLGVLDGEKATINAEEIAALVKVPTIEEIAAGIAERIQNG